MSRVNSIRSSFLDFYHRRGHRVIASSSLVPSNDPTLMFTNAGMVQFKNVFTGLEKRSYSRAVSAQKCVRAGGKHNDLDNVGYTARHHTFFEMLGNFSFGDYFKAEAIESAWHLITKEFSLSPDRLLVTVYHEDQEAYDLWKKIAGFSSDKIIRIRTSDNFWAMGDTGPCGPCSEIFFDQGPKIQGGPPGSAEEEGDRFLEFWNLVFMQYDQVSPETRLELPHPSIDTGMGLERMAAILQGVSSNYDIDLMRHIIESVADLTSIDPDGAHYASHRILADHLRACSFLIADGILPSNEGRGYVLRRIMRRAMRHAQILGAQEPLMWRLVPILIQEMGQAYPELVQAESLISGTLKGEEERFRQTLARGLGLLEEETKDFKPGQSLSGESAFKLYDTYGFPLDLTQEALRARQLTVDVAGFEAAMEKQKAEARRAWAGSGESVTAPLWFALRDSKGATEFLGYETPESEAQVLALVVEGEEVEQLKEGESGWMIVDQTPFYAESGGQVGDTGQGQGKGFSLRIENTLKKLGDLFIHAIKVEQGCLRTGASLFLCVDENRRQSIRAHHSATHLLHEALRYVLGDHVVQKGSLVNEERLRFDFTHSKPLQEEDKIQIEDLINKLILQNKPVTTQIMPLEDAMKSGARALFGEKYSEEVRVVSMGLKPDFSSVSSSFSTELCGGLHVQRTGDIGLFTLVSESSVASGIRRIEAKTGQEARAYLKQEERSLEAMAHLLRSSKEEAPHRLTHLLEERRKLEREVTELRRKVALGGDKKKEESFLKNIQGVSLFTRCVHDVKMKDLKSLADEARDSLDSGLVALVGVDPDNKAGIVVTMTPDLTSRFNAVTLVRLAAEILGGKGGGGRPDMAQAGGPNGSQAEAALQAIELYLENDMRQAG